jgi:hypothetical protein
MAISKGSRETANRYYTDEKDDNCTSEKIAKSLYIANKASIHRNKSPIVRQDRSVLSYNLFEND